MRDLAYKQVREALNAIGLLAERHQNLSSEARLRLQRHEPTTLAQNGDRPAIVNCISGF
ncbi:hypothetical protein D9M72_101750 [compost metagenome]